MAGSYPIKSKRRNLKHWLFGSFGSLLGLGLLIATLATGGLPAAVLLPIGLISGLVTLILGAQSYLETFKELYKRRPLNLDSLFSMASLSVVVVSIASLFVPWLPMLFATGLLIVGFRHIANAIQGHMEEKIHLNRNLQEKSILETQKRSRYLLPAVFALAFVLGTAASIAFSPLLGVQFFILFLLTAYPFTLSFISFAKRIGMKIAEGQGISFKNPTDLEELDQVDALILSVDMNTLVNPGVGASLNINSLRNTIKNLTAKGKDFHLYISGKVNVWELAATLKIDSSKIHVNSMNNSISTLGNLIDSGGSRVAYIEKGNSGDQFLVKMKKNPNSEIRLPNFQSIIPAFDIARQTIENIKQNRAFSLGYTGSFVLTAGILMFACGIAINPAIGVGLMAIEAGLVCLNMYRLHNKPMPPSDGAPAEIQESNRSMLTKMPPQNSMSPRPAFGAEPEQHKNLYALNVKDPSQSPSLTPL